MFCTYCKAARIENEAPCPNCGAPSPLAGWSQNTAQGEQASASSPSPWGDPTSFNGPQDNQAPQPWGGPTSFNGPQDNPIPQLSFGQLPMPTDNLAAQEQQEPKQSMLPVPYQAGMSMQQMMYQQNMSQQLVPMQNINQMLPALPDEQDAIYIPPMYTKPRPIIPTYRAISGLLSFLIVILALCGGAGYYAKVSGKFDQASHFLFGGSPPQSLKPTSVVVNNPQETADYGQASAVIPSATTTLQVENQIARETDRIFKPGQTFYVTFSVQHAPNKGVVTLKWYSNKNLLTITTVSPPVEAGTSVDGNVTMNYSLPCNGSVEIFWNNQLAQRLYFAIK